MSLSFPKGTPLKCQSRLDVLRHGFLAVSDKSASSAFSYSTISTKALGKPSPILTFDEAYFCYKGAVLVDGDKCRKEFRRLRDEPIREREPIAIDRLVAL
ncbi:hypothetical protein COOONC_18537 [Cooperia oncophora]